MSVQIRRMDVAMDMYETLFILVGRNVINSIMMTDGR